MPITYPNNSPASGDSDNQLLRKLLTVAQGVEAGIGGSGATEATLATRASEATLATLATQATAASTLSAVQANSNVGGFTAVLKVRPTVDTSAYVAGDCIGGKLTIANAVRASGGTGVLESLTIVDESNQKAALEIFLFDADPSACTLTDQAAVVIHTTDTPKILAHITVAASDYVTVSAMGFATFKGIGVTLKGAASTSLYAAIVAVGGPTYAGNNDLLLHFGVLQD